MRVGNQVGGGGAGGCDGRVVTPLAERRPFVRGDWVQPQATARQERNPITLKTRIMLVAPTQLPLAVFFGW